MPDQQPGIELTSAVAAARLRSLAIWIWSSLLISDVVLVTRRVAGEFATPLPSLLALSTTTVVAVASWVAWRFFTATQLGRSAHQPYHPADHDWERPPVSTFVPPGLSIIVTVIWIWSISAGAASVTFGCLMAILLLQTGAVISWDLSFQRAEAPAAPARSPTNKPVEADREITAAPPRATTPPDRMDNQCSLLTAEIDSGGLVDDLEEQPDPDNSDEVADENQTLWLARRLTDEGETIEGWVRVPFAAGQRETIVHVAFCPPLAGTPEIETEDLEGVGLEIRVAAVFPFGARLSVRRSRSSDECDRDRIGFTAFSVASRRAA